MLRRLACLGVLLPLGGCLAYSEHPAPPASVVVVPPPAAAPGAAPAAPAGGDSDAVPYVR